MGKVTSKEDLQKSINELNKRFGKGTVLSFGGSARGNHDAISSGSIGLDYIIFGVGGWVRGRMYELRGWEGTFKSTMCAHAVAECQKQGGRAAFIDSEYAINPVYFKNLGVDMDDLLLSQPDNGEEGFNTAVELIKSGLIDMLIIDSDSALIPKAVVDGEVGDSAIGKKARLNSDAYPKLKAMLVKHQVCVIVVSQYREKIGMMFGDPRTTQGGHALKYYSDCIMEISKTPIKDDGERATVKVKSFKNKLYSPYQKYDFEAIYGVGIDRVNEVLTLAVDLEFIKRSGSWYSYGDTKIGQGTDAVKDLLNDNLELVEELRTKVIEKLIKN